MTRTAAFRASILFVVLALVFGVIEAGSQAAVAQALFLISVSLCGLMVLFAAATPAHSFLPVRVRRSHHNR
jgi:hypothetical protein